jgi:hypothetical protein
MGIEGLDDILGGGITERRMYLVEGTPGAGKTTLALQFLLEGASRGFTLHCPRRRTSCGRLPKLMDGRSTLSSYSISSPRATSALNTSRPFFTPRRSNSAKRFAA